MTPAAEAVNQVARAPSSARPGRSELTARCQSLCWMRSRVLVMVLTLICGSGAAALPQQQSAPSAVGTDLDEVLITGEQSGPGLWKVSKGNHVLWILGRYGP